MTNKIRDYKWPDGRARFGFAKAPTNESEKRIIPNPIAKQPKQYARSFKEIMDKTWRHITFE